MKVTNLTPHVIRMNDGTEFAPSGTIARVSTSYTDFDERGVSRVVFGNVVGVPEPEEGTLFVVSGMVSAALPNRSDVVAPATGHPNAIRKDGQVFSVPGFVK